MHAQLLEALATERIKERQREAALYRLARRAGRRPRRRALTSAPAATEESTRRLRGEPSCAEC